MNASNVSDLILDKKKIGGALIAFSYAFFYLKNNISYKEALENVLLQGGDTDTNAAIVWGLLGARWSINQIPIEWINSLGFDNYRTSFVDLKNLNELESLIESLIVKSKSLYLSIKR